MSTNCWPWTRRRIERVCSSLADTPALGYRTYFVRSAANAGASLVCTPAPALVTANDNTIENGSVRVTVDPQTGCITSLFDKRNQTETLAPPETDTGGLTTSRLRQSVADFLRQAQDDGTPGTSTPISKSNIGIWIRRTR